MTYRAHESSPARKGRRGARLGPAPHPVGAVDLTTLNEATAVRAGVGEASALGVTDAEGAFEAPVDEGTGDEFLRQRRRPSQLHLLFRASTPHRAPGSGSEPMRRSGE